MTIETSKLFKVMGRSIGLKQIRKSHRGYIAKTVLPKVYAWETSVFKNTLKRISFGTIKVNDYLTGQIYYE